MPNYTYLIVGGGMTAASAVTGIREVDPQGSIGLLSAEEHPPYNRPPLSKKLWKGDSPDTIWRNIESPSVTLHLGRTAKHLDPKNQRVTDDQGTTYDYRKLLLATGGTPRRLPFGNDQVIYYRTFADYQRLRALTQSGQQFVVIGGGFIGSEVAAALAMNGKKVTIVIPDAGICSRLFPPDLVNFLNGYYRQKGVEVLTGHRVTNVDQRAGRPDVRVASTQGQGEREIPADGVVAGIGIEPNVELARQAGLETDNGIRVNENLGTSLPNIYAAGDVANFHNPALNKRLRVEHEDNANTMGRQAGQSMAGKSVHYDHLPSFYSDMFDLGYEAVGEVDSRLETFADWKQPHREGVVYYFRDGRVRGVLLWNVWEQVEAARKLIAEPGPFNRATLKGRLPQ